jgi:predicted ABC-type ATPase
MRQAKAAGYKVNLVFVGVDDPAICLARVVDRVRAGGHNVPPDAIMRRFQSALENLGIALGIADRTIVFDNSRTRRQLVLLYERNEPRFITKAVPPWVRRALPSLAWSSTEVSRSDNDVGR